MINKTFLCNDLVDNWRDVYLGKYGTDYFVGIDKGSKITKFGNNKQVIDTLRVTMSFKDEESALNFTMKCVK